MTLPADRREWLEPDGLGGFASGTASGVRTRRYHGLLVAATTPPTGRFTLVNGLEVWVERDGAREALSTQQYGPDVRHPDGERRIAGFRYEPWPTWRYRLSDGTVVEHEVFVPRGHPVVVCTWRAPGAAPGTVLRARPLLSGRDLHALHRENAAFRFDARRDDGRVVWRPYESLPAVAAAANGSYAHEPSWYRNFLYAEERARGFEHAEDLASPGVFSWDLAAGEAVLVLAADGPGGARLEGAVRDVAARLRETERARRAAFPSQLHRAADGYLARRGAGSTVIAGYPWFTDWGRDTFVSLRGLCLATGRLEEARQILLAWAGTVSEGMLPNRFLDQGDAPEYNSVDAALWYAIAAAELIDAAERAGRPVPAPERRTLAEAVAAILEGYSRGTRHGIRMDADGLLAAGAPGVQLTWMDAKIGDWVVTPRIGKPVEVQALWVNALEAGARLDRPPWSAVAARARRAFLPRFWNAASGHLHDVVDVGHQPGTADASFRPNQIFAVGGLPRPLLEGSHARSVVDAVEARLWTPLGLRSLAPGAPEYKPRYEGGPVERDAAYHQGTVWPWLVGPFVEAWVRVRGDTDEARRAARERFLAPILTHLDDAGLGHVSEIADADAPHTPRGCPFQAWSVAEALRLECRTLGR